MSDNSKISQPSTVVGSKTNHAWYVEHYENAITQRNIVLFLLIIGLAIIIVLVFAIMQVSMSKSFQPFVVQIQEATGLAKVVTPVEDTVLSDKESLNRYFIKKYLIARETYNPVDFSTIARNTVRLLSAPQIYYQYLTFIKNPANDPVALYGDARTTALQIKSWSRVDDGKYMVRFVVSTNDNSKVSNKIAVLQVAFQAMELQPNEMDINPIGFQITAYRIDDDNS